MFRLSRALEKNNVKLAGARVLALVRSPIGLPAKVLVGGKKVKPNPLSDDLSPFRLSNCAIALALLAMLSGEAWSG
jgi:hypothetical protein